MNQRYTAEAIDDIVKTLRDPVTPGVITKPLNITTYPNKVLLSYLVADEGLNREQLARLFAKPDKLFQRLLAVAPQKHTCSVQLSYGVGIDDPTTFIAGMIRRTNPELFAIGYDSVHDKEGLLVGRGVPDRFIYPSGLPIDYRLLINERSANISAFNSAYGYPNGTIYFRDTFLTVMLARFDFLRSNASFAPLIEAVPTFERNIVGISIAHERQEIAMNQQGTTHATYVDRELAVEREARTFLEQQGVPRADYALYHALRARATGRRKNVSQLVLEELNLAA